MVSRLLPIEHIQFPSWKIWNIHFGKFITKLIVQQDVKRKFKAYPTSLLYGSLQAGKVAPTSS